MAELWGTDRRVIVLALARFAEAMGNSFLIIVLPLIVSEGLLTGTKLGMPDSIVIGIIISVTGLISSMFQPIPGRLSDMVGRRREFVLGGLGVRTITFFGYIFAPTYLILFAIRSVQGIGSSFTVAPTLALISEYSGEGDRGGGMGAYAALRLLGSGIGPIVAGFIVALGPYTVRGQAISGIIAALIVAACAAALSFLMVGVLVFDPDQTQAKASRELSFKLLADRPDRLLAPVFVLSITALLFGINISMIATLQPQINARLDQGSAWFGIQYAAFLISLVAFAAPFGRLSDRFGRRPWLVLTWFILAPATLAQGLVVTSVGMLVTRIGQGFASAMAYAPAVAMVGDRADMTGSGASTQLSMFSMMLGVGLGVGPIFAGTLVVYGYSVPFIVASALAVLGLVMIYTQTAETHRDFREDPTPVGHQFLAAIRRTPGLAASAASGEPPADDASETEEP